MKISRNTRIVGSVILLALVTITGVTAFVQSGGRLFPPPLPNDPEGSQVVLLQAQRFSVEQPYTHYWRSEMPSVDHGWLVVLGVDGDLVYPRQMRQPVLYAGAEVVERINVGYPSGRVVCLIPGDVDLARQPIFFGEPALPEELSSSDVEESLRVAVERGMVGPGMERLLEVQGSEVRAKDQYDLYRIASFLIEEHSPDEVDLVQGLRAPRVH